MSMVVLDLYSLTDVRRPGALRALGAAFDEEPRLKPDRMDRRDPIREKIASVADYLGRIEDEAGTGFESHLYERRTRPRLGGGVSFERQAPERLEIPHRVYVSVDEDELLAAPELIEPLGDLFVRLAGAFDAFYGFATHSKLPWQQRVELVEAARRGELAPVYPTAATDRTSVRDVYWINFFGPAYVELWAGRLDGLGVRSVETPNGGRVVWAAQTPFLYDEGFSSSVDYPWKQPFFEALGRDTFVHRLQVQSGNVPSFDDHRRLTVRPDEPA